jgi:ABC-type amino acid transport system permease subunit
MPWVFHRVALDELVMIVNLDLIECIQSFIITLVVSAANQEKLLSVWILYTLEIVRKTAIIVWLHLYRLNGLVPDV